MATPDLIKVDCDKGKTIKDALKHADPGDTIRVTGICTERVVIKTSRITLDGQGTAVLDGAGRRPTGFGDGGVLVIDGAHGVRSRGSRSRMATATASVAAMVPRSRSTTARCETSPARASSS